MFCFIYAKMNYIQFISRHRSYIVLVCEDDTFVFNSWWEEISLNSNIKSSELYSLRNQIVNVKIFILFIVLYHFYNYYVTNF